MKKLVIFAVVGLLLSTIAFARIIVLQDGQTKSYSDSRDSIVIDGKTPASVLFDGVLIKVPANKRKVTIKRGEGKEGEINISGRNLKDIDIAGKKISSNGQATITFSPKTREISVVNGELANNDNAAPKNAAQKTVKQAATKSTVKSTPATQVVVETVEFPEVSDYVNEVTAQQSVQDVEDMSQSSPRS